jgi:hypothetical protein
MKYAIPSISVIVLFACCIFSCKKEKQQAVDIGYSYYPDKAGNYIV